MHRRAAVARARAVLAGAVAPALRAATTERVVVDRHTGLALYGVDPVAYFTDGKPVAGRAGVRIPPRGRDLALPQ